MSEVTITVTEYFEESHELIFSRFVDSCDFHEGRHECDFVRDSLGIRTSKRKQLQQLMDETKIESFKELMNYALTLLVHRQGEINQGRKVGSMDLETNIFREPKLVTAE